MHVFYHTLHIRSGMFIHVIIQIQTITLYFTLSAQLQIFNHLEIVVE